MGVIMSSRGFYEGLGCRGARNLIRYFFDCAPGIIQRLRLY